MRDKGNQQDVELIKKVMQQPNNAEVETWLKTVKQRTIDSGGVEACITLAKEHAKKPWPHCPICQTPHWAGH